MSELLSIGILPLFLTLGAYQIGLLCQKKLKTAIANPVLISVVLVLAFMGISSLNNTDYQAGMTKFSWLLTPATVCLAIPMYQHSQTLRRNLPAILVGIAAGTVGCMAMVLLWAVAFRIDRTLAISLLPKSVTSAIGVPLCEMAGGIGSISTAIIILTGILGNMMGGLFCKLFRLTDPVAQGVAFGTSSHVIGTTKASEISELTGAVSSFSLVVAGLLTAVFFPLFAQLL
ncbi:MAG: LrgB family protein [Oscillospiraceae bacterium]|nr:LrgB family protein [Oscillospiraceae bacterium]